MRISRKSRSGMATALLLLVCPILFAAALAVFGRTRDESHRLRGIAARKRALFLADGGFDWAMGKLSEVTESPNDRWYFRKNKGEFGSLSRKVKDGSIDVFVVDVFNSFDELDAFFIVSRGMYRFASTKRVSAVTFGLVRLVEADDGSFLAAVLHRRSLDPQRFALFLEKCPKLFSKKENPFVSKAKSAAYEGHLDGLIEILKENRLDKLSYADADQLLCLTRILLQRMRIQRMVEIARAFHDLSGWDAREAALESLQSSPVLMESSRQKLEGLFAKLDSLAPDSGFSTVQAESILSSLSRTKRELVVIRLLLGRLAELGSDTKIYLKGEELSPKAAALVLAQSLYEEITSVSTTDTRVGTIIGALFRKRSSLKRVNVLNRLYHGMDEKDKIVMAAEGVSSAKSTVVGARGTVPLRALVLAMLRAYPIDPSRIPSFAFTSDVFRNGKSARGLFRTSPSSEEGGSPVGTVSTSQDYLFQRTVSMLPKNNDRRYEQTLKGVTQEISCYLNQQFTLRGKKAYEHLTALAGQVGVNQEQQTAIWTVIFVDGYKRWTKVSQKSFDDPLDEPAKSPCLHGAVEALVMSAMSRHRIGSKRLEQIENDEDPTGKGVVQR